MQDICVVIVNYNVKHFLKQCLDSVIQAYGQLNVDIIVVDNQSIDGSVAMLREEFPSVMVIDNKENVGFAKANNQALRIVNAKYTLILNPDTVIQKDTLRKCFDFSESHDDVGIIGVRMVDGAGEFLAESKRGFPSPKSAFWKLTGISKLFPKSKYFNSYNLGYIGEYEEAEVDVLCGAFMFARTDLLKELDYFDEAFFMYGEDIDLSYRMQLLGYKNYYLPSTSIIHYKGQSTKKSELKYVGVFYKAMLIFAKKHFGKAQGGWLIGMLTIAIYLRAFGSAVKRIVQSIYKPILDFIIIAITLWVIKNIWGTYYFGESSYFNDSPVKANIIGYSFILVFSIFISGGYRDYFNLSKLFRAVIIGAFIILGTYALLPVSWRTSRALIIIGIGTIPMVLFMLRYVLHQLQYRRSILKTSKVKKIAIVGSIDEISRVASIINNKKESKKSIFAISTESKITSSFYDGNILNLNELLKIENIDELIFCLKDLEISNVLTVMSSLDQNVSYKVVGDESLSIVGSKASNAHGEFYTMDVDFAILKPERKIQKRVFDVLFSIIYILFLFLIFVPNCLIVKEWTLAKVGYRLKYTFGVFLGKNTMISYRVPDGRLKELPIIKSGDFPLYKVNDDKSNHEMNKKYAINYTFVSDLYHLIRNVIANKI